nr:MAG TPA: hypothetical protein [Caudoviricetes sp.]
MSIPKVTLDSMDKLLRCLYCHPGHGQPIYTTYI